jgi:O-antigen ligase
MGPTFAGAAILAPTTLFLLLRPAAGLALGLAIVLAIPSWYVLGAEQLGVARVASLLALSSVLFGVRRRLQLPDAALATFVAVVVLGWILQNHQPSVGRIVLAEFVPLCFYVGARALPAAYRSRLFTVTVIMGTVGALTVIYEYLIGSVVFADPESYVWSGSSTTIFRPGGVYGSPPGAATVLVFTVLMGLPLLRTTRGLRKGLLNAALGCMGVAIILTFTRANLIALGIAMVAYLWLTGSTLLTPFKVGVVATCLVFASVLVLPRLESHTTFQQGLARSKTLSAREGYWRQALPIVTENTRNLLFGIGSEATLSARQGTNPVPGALASSPDLILHGTHNQYVLTLLEQGLVGLAAMLAWLGAVIANGARLARRHRDHALAALTSSMLGFAIAMLAGNHLLHGPSFALAALASGLLVNGWQAAGRPVQPGHAHA